MNEPMQIDSNTRAGTIGGTLLIVILNAFTNDIIRTVLFAGLGASVSFFVSLFWKYITRRWQQRKK